VTESIDPAEAERHRAKMAKRKAVQDAEVAEKTVEKGLLIVHTGTGKGKSTAAFGLALRMLGRDTPMISTAARRAPALGPWLDWLEQQLTVRRLGKSALGAPIDARVGI